MPSQVLANFMRTRLLLTPASSYSAINYCKLWKIFTFALLICAYLSKLSLASTCVETYPMLKNYESTWNQLQYLDTETHAHLITNVFNDKFFLSGIEGIKIELTICKYLGIILYRLLFIYFTLGLFLRDAFYRQGSNCLFQN